MGAETHIKGGEKKIAKPVRGGRLTGEAELGPGLATLGDAVSAKKSAVIKSLVPTA